MGCTLASGKRTSKLSKNRESLSDFAKRPLMPLPTKSDKMPFDDLNHNDHLCGQVSIKPLIIDHSNSIHKKLQYHTNNFVSTKGNLSDDSHLNHQAPILESRLNATPMDSILKENNTLIGKDFDSILDFSVHEESGLDIQDAPADKQRPNNIRFFNNHLEISQIPSDESLIESQQGRQGKPATENFQLDLSDFPEYKFFDEKFGTPSKQM